VSPIWPADDTWQTIAQDSIFHWQNIARDATLHWQEKNGLFKRFEIVSEHVADSLPQDMPRSAIEFVYERKISEVPLPLSNTAISSSKPLVMSSTKLPSDLDSSDVIGLTKLSSSLY
jgi:hypothetical protein